MEVLLLNNEGNILKFSFPPPQFFRVFVSIQTTVQVTWLEDCSSSERKDDKGRKKLPFFFLARENTPVHVENDYSQTCFEWVHLYLIVTP